MCLWAFLIYNYTDTYLCKVTMEWKCLIIDTIIIMYVYLFQWHLSVYSGWRGIYWVRYSGLQVVTSYIYLFAEVMMFSCLAWHFLVCDIYITEEALAHELLIILFPINTILVLIILSHLNKLFLTRCSWPNMKLVHLDACVRITI